MPKSSNIQDMWSIEPEPRGDEITIDIDSAPNSGIRLVTLFSSSMIRHWAVIVETWDHKNCGRGKRLYNQQFTDAEKKVINRYHKKLWVWTMQRGFPDEVAMSFATYDLMNRAADFFASF